MYFIQAAEFGADRSDENERHSKVPRTAKITSTLQKPSSDKLDLSSAQSLRRRKKTLSVLRPIHCGTAENNVRKPVLDGIWSTLVGSTTKEELARYIAQSNVCTSKVLPKIVSENIKQYEKSEANTIRSLRILYEGGIMSKRKYTTIRNCSDLTGDKQDESVRRNIKTEFMKGCEIPKLVPYKQLMKTVNTIDIGEVVDLETLAVRLSAPSVPGVYRPLKPFLLRLADLYITLHEKSPCLHWFNDEENVLVVAVGADGAPFGKDNTATGRILTKIIVNLIYWD